MLHHGDLCRGSDDSQSLAKTVLGVIISFRFGGPTLVSEILHIAKLNSPFLCEQTRLTIDAINPFMHNFVKWPNIL